jgi:hypothetical protein
VQGYAYGRGEETPVFILERKTQDGIFDHYVSIAKHVLASSRNVQDAIEDTKRGVL